MISLENVCTKYGSVPMLDGVTLTVAPGKLVTLLGTNGAGKTTTFKTITGGVKPYRGTVKINGTDTSSLGMNRIARLGLGVVPESRRLFPNLTVTENLKIGFGLNTSGSSFSEALDPITDRFPRIKERLHQTAGTLSGGEQAMVALARALISQPKYIIMDEPSLGLAPNLVDEYFAMVASLKGGDQAILLIEQNVAQSLAISDTTYILRKGVVAYEGPSADLLSSGKVGDIYLGKE